MSKDDKVREIWDSIVPDLVEDHFPKGQCKERGQAIVLVALIYCQLLPKLQALYKPSHKKIEELLGKWNITKELGFRYKLATKIAEGDIYE